VVTWGNLGSFNPQHGNQSISTSLGEDDGPFVSKRCTQRRLSGTVPGIIFISSEAAN